MQSIFSILFYVFFLLIDYFQILYFSTTDPFYSVWCHTVSVVVYLW